MYYLFSFKTRFDTMKLYSLSKRNGIKTVIISTPTSIFSGCSLSLRCEESEFVNLLNLYCANSFSSFAGAYVVMDDNISKVY